MGMIVVSTLLIVMILAILSRVSFDGREASVVAYEWRTCHVFYSTVKTHSDCCYGTWILTHVETRFRFCVSVSREYVHG